jgi:hypothetical protein
MSVIDTGYPAWTDGGTYNGLLLRQVDGVDAVHQAGTATTIGPFGGVYPAPWDYGVIGPLQAGIDTGLTLTIGAGYCAIPYSTSGNGVARFGLLSSGTLTCATANGTNPRIDLIVAQIHDLGTSGSFADINIITGTPTAGATLANLNGLPATPTNSIALTCVLVPANASTLVTGDLLDVRPLTVAPGGVLPVNAATQAPAAAISTMIFNLATNQAGRGKTAGGGISELGIFGGSVTAYGTSDGCVPGVSGVWVTALSEIFAADGRTDYQMVYGWNGITTADTTVSFCKLSLWVDNAIVDTIDIGPCGSTFRRGNQAVYFTSPQLNTTPGKGTHTAALKAQSSQYYYYSPQCGFCGDQTSECVTLAIRPVMF